MLVNATIAGSVEEKEAVNGVKYIRITLIEEQGGSANTKPIYFPKLFTNYHNCCA